MREGLRVLFFVYAPDLSDETPLIDSDDFMEMYIGNVAMVIGECDVECIRQDLEHFYGMSVGTVQRVTPQVPYSGEIRDRDNTLVHIATPVRLPNDLYDTTTVRNSFDLAEVGMSEDAFSRADLVLVLLQDDKGGVYYYPYKVAMYRSSEE